jgi:Zn-dependent alcohol dehydrogenase
MKRRTRPGDPFPMDHEYVGIVEEVGAEVTTSKHGQFVILVLGFDNNTL